jgi:hypothetical protein
MEGVLLGHNNVIIRGGQKRELTTRIRIGNAQKKIPVTHQCPPSIWKSKYTAKKKTYTEIWLNLRIARLLPW